MLGLNGKLLDFIYPVGSYYETSDTSFNPNIAWGGTWLEDTKGRVTVALDSDDTDFASIGATGGSKYLQEHTHHYLTSGKAYNDSSAVSNLLARGISNYDRTQSTQATGNGDSGNLQPYIVVKRWHRTA